MGTVDTKNYKKYLTDSDKRLDSKQKPGDSDFTEQFVLVDHNNPNLISINNANSDGSWSTTRIVLEGQTQDNIKKVSDLIAQQIFTKNTSKLKSLKLKEVAVKDHRKYSFPGNSSIKELLVDIHSCESEDDSLLHFLLGKVKSA